MFGGDTPDRAGNGYHWDLLTTFSPLPPVSSVTKPSFLAKSACFGNIWVSLSWVNLWCLPSPGGKSECWEISWNIGARWSVLPSPQSRTDYRDKLTGMILFQGRVVDPSAWVWNKNLCSLINSNSETSVLWSECCVCLWNTGLPNI